MFNRELRYLVDTYETAEHSSNQNYQLLLDFSLGRASSPDTMDALGIDSQEDLFLLMTQAHLPMPRLPEQDTQDMINQLNDLIKP